MADHTCFLFIFNPGWERPWNQPHSLISPYDILPSLQHSDKQQPFIDTGMVMAAAEVATSPISPGTIQNSSQQARAVATTPSLLGNVTNSKNLVSAGALPSLTPLISL